MRIEEAAVAGGQDDENTVVTDEDTFVMPPAWRKVLLPRRGGIPGPALRPDAAGGAELVRAANATIKARLAQPTNDPLLVNAAEDYLADPATGSATGAGVVAGLASPHLSWRET